MSFGAEVVQSLRQLLSRMQKVLVNPDGIAADPQAVGFDGSTMAAAVGTASSSWSLGAGTDVVNRVLKGPGREPDGEPHHQEDKEWQKQQHRAQQAQADDVGESVEWVNMCWRKVGWGAGGCGGHTCWGRCGQGVCITKRRRGRQYGGDQHLLAQGGLGCGWRGSALADTSGRIRRGPRGDMCRVLQAHTGVLRGAHGASSRVSVPG